MKKFGLLLCLLLGLTACEQEAEKDPVFVTLDEAIEAYLQENPNDKLEEIYQIENAHIAAFSGDVEDRSISDKGQALGVIAYYRVYEETADGFVLREDTNEIHLDDTKCQTVIFSDASWVDGTEGEEPQYYLKGVGFGNERPTAEEMKELGFSDFGEIHEREGLYFAFAFGIE